MASDFLTPGHFKVMLDIRRDPAFWAEKIFGVRTGYVDPWKVPRVYENQRRLLETPFRIRPESRGKTAIGSGHMTGKTEAVKILTILWLLSHYPAFVIILGDTQAAITQKIFPGLRAKLMEANRNLREVFKGSIPTELLNKLSWFEPKLFPDRQKWELDAEYGAYGFSPDMPEPLQGYHSPGAHGGTLFIADEANATPADFMPTIRVYARNPRNYVMLLGNPTSQDSQLSSIIRRDPGFEDWEAFSISSWDTPNAVATLEAIKRGELTDEQAINGREMIVPGFEGLATYSFCREYQQQQVNYFPRVLGLPPEQSEDTWISRRLITECGERAKNFDLSVPAKSEILCCDPAWSVEGDDSVLLSVSPDRNALMAVSVHRGFDETALLGRIVALCLERPAISEVRIEGDGIGAPLGHRLRRLFSEDLFEEDPNLKTLRARLCQRGHIPVVEIIMSAGKAHDAVANINRRAENWRAMKLGLEKLVIPLQWLNSFYEISKLKYVEPPNGRLQMESKRDFKKRGNPSPNYADALALYFARQVGDPLFSILDRTHKNLQMDMKPAVRSVDGGAVLYWEALGPGVGERVGKLGRAWWWSRRGESAALWVHVDQKQNWTVIDALSDSGMHLQAFTERVFERSFDALGQPMRFSADVCSAYQASVKFGVEDYYHDLIDSTLRKLVKERRLSFVSTPWPMPAADLGGIAGLDLIDRMISAHGCAASGVLAIWPSVVVAALERARLRNSSLTLDEEDDLPQEGIGGGGAFVRCLRALAIHGV